MVGKFAVRDWNLSEMANSKFLVKPGMHSALVDANRYIQDYGSSDDDFGELYQPNLVLFVPKTYQRRRRSRKHETPTFVSFRSDTRVVEKIVGTQGSPHETFWKENSGQTERCPPSKRTRDPDLEILPR